MQRTKPSLISLHTCEIFGYQNEVDYNCVLLGYYIACSNTDVSGQTICPISKGQLKMGHIRGSKKSRKGITATRCVMARKSLVLF